MTQSKRTIFSIFMILAFAICSVFAAGLVLPNKVANAETSESDTHSDDHDGWTKLEQSSFTNGGTYESGSLTGGGSK